MAITLKEIRRRMNKELEFRRKHFEDDKWATYDTALRKEAEKYMRGKLTNAMRTRVEVSDFKKNKPRKYFAYLDKDKHGWKVTTWTGATLMRVIVHNIADSNWGDERYYFTSTYSINGVSYHGIGYGGKGLYCRITAHKNQ